MAVTQDKETTVFRSSEDFHALPPVQKAADKVLNSFKGDFSRLPPSPKSKEKPRVAFQATGRLADYLHAPPLDIWKMHKEDNIQAIVSTPRPSLIAEEKEARDQLKRAVDFHESFIQSAKFLSTLQEGPYPLDKGSLSVILKDYASYFSLCGTSFEKEVSYFAEKTARKKMEVKLAAINNFVNPTLRTPFMTAALLSPNLVSAEGARATVKAFKDLPDRVLEKAFKDPNLPMEAVRRSLPNPPWSRSPRNLPLALLWLTNISLNLLHNPITLKQLLHPSRRELLPLATPTRNPLCSRVSPPFPERTTKEEGSTGTGLHKAGSMTGIPTKEGGIEDGGRLQMFQEAWEGAPVSTRTIIKRGFHWEWISGPPALTTPKLKAGNPDIGEVSKLLQKRAIYKVPLQPCFSANLFSVPKASGGSRPIIDLSRLNKFVKAPHFSMTNHNTLRDLITEASWGGLSRPPGRLPACPNQEESSQVHGLLTRPSALLLQGSSLRSQCSSNDLHKNFKVSSQPPSPGGYPRASLPR